MSGSKILEGLKDAVAGNFASVTIEGQRWVRADAPETFNPEADIAKMLQDPAVVHLNMLRGGIAKPSWANIKHLYPEQFAENANSIPTPSTATSDGAAEALRLLAAQDDRLTKLHEILETIREQIRLGVKSEHRPEGLFQNIQDAVYAMRGRTLLMNDAAITGPLKAFATPAPSDAMTVDAEELAIWLHNETDHPEHCPGYTWPENEHDDGRREGGFVKIVPKYAQEYFRDIAHRMIAGPLSRQERLTHD